MTKEERLKQLCISSILGDGCIHESYISTNCVHLDYINYKKELIKEYNPKVSSNVNMGYKKGSPINNLTIHTNPIVKEVINWSLEELLNNINELGLALWFYDDGSRHKKNNFYNLCTHSFTREQEEDLIIPVLNKFNIFPKILIERKKDGREFTYLYISKYFGAFEVSKILRKYPIECYDYKLIPEDLENAYFSVKDSEEFVKASVHRKTNIIKEYLKMKYSEKFEDKNTSQYVNSDIYINEN